MGDVSVVFTDYIGNKKASVILEIANTPEARRIGLAKRAALEDGHGMLFDRVGVYWMKDVNFPLDLTFVTKSGEVVETLHMPVDKDGVFHYSPSSNIAHKVAYAIETPMGFIDAHGIVPGDVVTRVKEDK